MSKTNVVVLLVAVAMLSVVQFAKGYAPFNGIEYHAIHYWFLNYSEGFINRGLLGTLVLPIIQNTGAREFVDLIPVIYCGMFLICILQLVVMFPLLIGKRSQNLYLLTLILVICGQFFPVIGYIVGYPDLICFILLNFSLFFFIKKQFWWSVLLNVVGVLIHECHAFLAIPLLVCSLLDKPGIERRRALFVWFVPLLIVPFCHLLDSPERATSSIVGAPIPENGMNYLRSYGLRQSIGLTVSTIMRMFSESEVPWILYVLSLLPVISFVLIVALTLEDSRKTVILSSTALVSPLLILFFGWDTFRFLIFAQVGMIHLTVWFSSNPSVFPVLRLKPRSLLPLLLCPIFLFEPLAIFTLNQPRICANVKILCTHPQSLFCSGPIYRELLSRGYKCPPT